jgi:hypothetical protein
MRAVRFPRAPSRDRGASPAQLDRDVAQLLRWLAEAAQDRTILAQKMDVTDRRMRRTIEEARRRGELVITTPGPLHLYRLAETRPEYELWKRLELMSRMGTFGAQLRAMDAAADRRWPAEQLRIAL